jgi:hypothetical protein
LKLKHFIGPSFDDYNQNVEKTTRKVWNIVFCNPDLGEEFLEILRSGLVDWLTFWLTIEQEKRVFTWKNMGQSGNRDFMS